MKGYPSEKRRMATWDDVLVVISGKTDAVREEMSRGFADLHGKTDAVREETARGFVEVSRGFADVSRGFAEVTRGFAEVTRGFAEVRGDIASLRHLTMVGFDREVETRLNTAEIVARLVVVEGKLGIRRTG